jgi:hypothetical protein
MSEFVSKLLQGLGNLQDPAYLHNMRLASGMRPADAIAINEGEQKAQQSQQMAGAHQAMAQMDLSKGYNPNFAQMLILTGNPEKAVDYYKASNQAPKLQFNPVTGEMFDMNTGTPYEGGQPPTNQSIESFSTKENWQPSGFETSVEKLSPKLLQDVKEKTYAKKLENVEAMRSSATERLNLLQSIEGKLSNIENPNQFTEEKATIANAGIPFVSDLAGGKQLAETVRSLQSDINQVSQTYRKPGTGAVSDYDAKKFAMSAPSVENPPEANRQIIAGQKAQAERDIDYANTISHYFSQGYDIAEIEKSYKQYANANPIFSDNGVNQSATKTFDEWLQAGSPDNSNVEPNPPPKQQEAVTQIYNFNVNGELED